MNPSCEKVMAALVAGGLIRRFWALRHAGRCPHCARARDELKPIAETLREVPPLTAAERRLWAAVAGDDRTREPARAWWLLPAVAGTLAALLLAAAGAWRMFRPVDRGVDPPPVAQGEPRAGTPKRLPEVENLRGNVLALASELDELKRRAELLDARREVEALMARLASRGAASGL